MLHKIEQMIRNCTYLTTSSRPTHTVNIREVKLQDVNVRDDVKSGVLTELYYISGDRALD